MSEFRISAFLSAFAKSFCSIKAAGIQTSNHISTIVEHSRSTKYSGSIFAPRAWNDEGFSEWSSSASKNGWFMKLIHESHRNQYHSAAQTQGISPEIIDVGEFNSNFAPFGFCMFKFNFGIKQKLFIEAVAQINYSAQEIDLIRFFRIHTGISFIGKILIQHFS